MPSSRSGRDGGPAGAGVSDDVPWMRRALELARRGFPGASPNPMVGAVVLDAAGRLAGEGWHAVFGGPHAEVEALRAAGARARGGTLYVTLEPCAHQGKTPPCTEAIVAAGVRRVVVGMRDPNPEAAGGVERLEAAGVEVAVGVEARAARELNRRWLVWAERRRPWVTLKVAMSLDGKIATRSGDSRWITGEAARRAGLELREEHDAILVGVGTVLADDPRLTRRLGRNPSPRHFRCVLDSRLRTPPDAALLAEAAGEVVLLHTPDAAAGRRRRLEAAGARLVEVPAGPDGRVELAAALEALAALPVATLLVEGGAEVHGAFVDGAFVDEVVVYVAPRLLGGREAPSAVGGDGVTRLTDAVRLAIRSVRRLGGDLEVRADTLDRRPCSRD